MHAQHRESHGFAPGKAEPPSVATMGGTHKRPQSVTFFPKVFSHFAPKSLEHLEKMYARHKKLWHGIGQA